MDTGLDQISSWSDHSVAFDANSEFLGFTEVDATQYIFDNYVQLTTGLLIHSTSDILTNNMCIKKYLFPRCFNDEPWLGTTRRPSPFRGQPHKGSQRGSHRLHRQRANLQLLPVSRWATRDINISMINKFIIKTKVVSPPLRRTSS